MLSRSINTVLAACLTVLPLGAVAAGLSVLLTNDDGYDSPGIRALEAALVDAGHDVTIVAPLTQQSGSGMKVSLGALAVVEQRDDVWTVDGSPADAVSIGVHRLMKAAPPDVVISGANLGQNLGSNVMWSGTVGAAAMAAHAGIPAIAVSVGIDLAEQAADPERFPSTLDAFPRAARLTVRLLAVLASRREAGAALLPSGTVLNLNYPGLPKTSIKGIRAAPVGSSGGFRLVYPEEGGGSDTIRSAIERDPRGTADTDADTGLFAAGFVTVSVIEPRWNVPESAASRWIHELENELQAEAP